MTGDGRRFYLFIEDGDHHIHVVARNMGRACELVGALDLGDSIHLVARELEDDEARAIPVKADDTCPAACLFEAPLDSIYSVEV